MGVRLYVNDKPVDTIFYTIDGSMPTENSAIFLTPIELEESTTIKAFAVFEDGSIGPISEASYILSPRLPLPRFTPPNGANSPTIVSIQIPEVPDADIWYTTNGSTPSDTNGSYYTAPLAISGTVTLKAIGYRTGYRPSRIGTASYAPPDYSFGQLPAVTFRPSNLTALPFPVNVQMSCPGHPQATILYTTDGTTPTYTSAVYPNQSVAVNTGTVKAFAIELRFAPSNVATITYTRAAANDPIILPPTNTPIPLNTTVTMQNGQVGAVLYYTVDGTNPVPP